MQRDWTILVDEREKKPLPFPSHLVVADPSVPALTRRRTTVRLSIHKARLPTADYALEGHESVILVERKAHLDELHNNLLVPDGRRRFIAELERLRSSCLHPHLLLEGTPLSLSRCKEDTDPVCTRDSILRLCLEYHVTMHLLPTSTIENRRAAGEWIAALLIAGAVAPPPISQGASHADPSH